MKNSNIFPGKTPIRQYLMIQEPNEKENSVR